MKKKELKEEEVVLIISQATRGGGIPVGAYGAFDMSYPNSKTRRGRVQEGGDVSPTITASNQEIAVVIPHIAAMRGRNPDDPSDRRRGSPTRQRIEIGSDETSNTLTSVQKDNLVVEPGCIVAGMLDIKGHEFIRRVHDAAGVSPTIPFCGGGGQQPKIIVVGNSVKSGHAAGNVVDDKGIAPTVMENHGTVTKVVAPGRRKVRVRKLTEKECWRLMAVKDEDYCLVARHQSSSSMYHLAGDSIVTTCNMAIFGELFGIEWRSKVRALVEALKEKEDSV